MTRLRPGILLSCVVITVIVSGSLFLRALAASQPAAQSAGDGARAGGTGRQAAASTGEPSPASPELVQPGALEILDTHGRPAGECPLKHTDVRVDISGFVAGVMVQQEFHNTATSPVEAVYTFPLPDDASVNSMTMTIGDRVIKGEIRPRDEAREIYEAAKSAGKAAALLDEERPNIFTQSVANLMPGQDVSVEIRYVHLLKYDDGRYEFSFPMVVGPRFIPGAAQPVSGPAPTIITDAPKITPPVTPPNTRSGHDISLTVHLASALPLQELQSVMHPVTVQWQGPDEATIRLKDQASIPNKDFILRYTVAGQEIQAGLLSAAADSGGGGYFTLILQPPLAPPQTAIAPKEMVFVIDQTGSQAGWPLEKAKETMRYCIRHLNPGDTFQLLGFDTELYPCFPKPVLATPETIEKALTFLDPIQGTGGTDILKAVDYALRLPDDPARLRIVCYMTDGYVGNDLQILDTIKRERGRARMFPFGIGNAVNRFLIDGMAREGRGAPDYVTLDEPGQQAAERFYRRVAQPILLDPQVDWSSLPVADVYPRAIPDVFSYGPIILKGRYTRPGTGVITLRGLLRGKPWSESVHVTFGEGNVPSAVLSSLWAREKIADLEEQDWLGEQSGTPDPAIQAQIVKVALAYHLMSPYTSFVAVEQKIINVGGQNRTVDVPVEMPEGVSYEGVFGPVSGEMKMPQRPLVVFGSPMSRHSSYGGGFRGAGGSGAMGGLPAAGFAGAPEPAAPASARAAAAGSGAAGLGSPLSGVDAPPSGLVRALQANSPAAATQLDNLTPEQRRNVLRYARLDAGLLALLTKFNRKPVPSELHQPGLPEVADGRVTVVIRLSMLSAGKRGAALAKIKAAGVTSVTTLESGKTLVGQVAPGNLDALIALPFISRVEVAEMK